MARPLDRATATRPRASPTIETVPQTAPSPLAEFSADRCIPASSRILDAPAALRFWHLASLDAPTVAVVWSLAFAWAAGIRLPVWIPVLLALTAWAVYIADRLLDARSAPHTGRLHRLQERHRFHWRHRRIFLPLAIVAACAAACIVVILMPTAARERNSILAVAALAYFTRVHSSRRLPSIPLSSPFRVVRKELLVGLLFTAGCALPAFSRAAVQGSMPLWPLSAAMVFFALLAWLNCHAIERWESDPSADASRVFFLPSLLALLGLLLAFLLFIPEPRSAALVASGAVSALLLALLERKRNSLSPLALRVAADLVLLTPLALLPK
jgi:hypothetical protein